MYGADVYLFLILLMLVGILAHFMFAFLKGLRDSQDRASDLRLETFSLESKVSLLETEVSLLKSQIQVLERQSDFWFEKSVEVLDKLAGDDNEN